MDKVRDVERGRRSVEKDFFLPLSTLTVQAEGLPVAVAGSIGCGKAMAG
jgi:hypothetical protein